MEKNRVIFNKKLLERSIANYSFGNLSEKIMIIKKWFEFYEKGVMDKTKETVLQGDFLTDFFGKIFRTICVFWPENIGSFWPRTMGFMPSIVEIPV